MASIEVQIADYVKSDFQNSTIGAILRAPVVALLGVDADASAALKLLSIETVFDLGASEAFAGARKLYDAHLNPRNFLVQHGSAASDLIRSAVAGGKPVAELANANVGALARIPEANIAQIEKALDVKTVQDFANYPPYRAAARILEKAYFPESLLTTAAEKEELSYRDLVPTNEYPVEKTQYSVLLMDEIKVDGATPGVDITSSQFAPLDLMRLAAEDEGFKKVAFGALLTFTHAWYSQGVALGQLLHTVSLAPGESTRIAVVGWSRKTSASQDESDMENSSLSNDTSHDRAINEVANATAREAQAGFSGSDIHSKSTQSAVSTSTEINGQPLGGLFRGATTATGTSDSEATSDTNAHGYSISSGNRAVASEMTQKVNESTHQNAHSVRGKRASVVKEVSESEKESISTRVLANYNHMHALNIQYYEVVQIYRTKVTVSRVERVVFIPVKLFDFNDDNLIRRFRGVLRGATPSWEIRDALEHLDTVQLVPEDSISMPALGGHPIRKVLTDRLVVSQIIDAGLFKINPVIIRSNKIAGTQQTTNLVAQGAEATAQATESAAPAATGTQDAQSVRASVASQRNLLLRVSSTIWDPLQSSKLASLLRRPVFLDNSPSFTLPTDVNIVDSDAVAGEVAVKESFRLVNGTVVEDVSSTRPVALRELEQIVIKGSSPEKAANVKITLTLSRNGIVFPFELPEFTVPKGTNLQTVVMRARVGGINVGLKEHLKQNKNLFNIAILKSLSSTQIALLLSGYTIPIEGIPVPVAQVVEPRPIRYIGNYLAFKMNSNINDPAWAKWLKEHDNPLGNTTEDIVPLPSGGTFAEAVLGRSNSAEKLDITRFWNCQDSPIPLQPTEISAIQSGSRARDPGNLSPSQMGNPMINITQPSSLPDPSGMAGVLAAIQNGNMFRDMSGLQATIAAAQAAGHDTQQGASTAGQQAGENMNNMLKANTERQRIAAQMVTDLAKTAASVYTGGLAGGGGSGVSAGNHSQDGAKINYFDKTATPGKSSAPGSSSGPPSTGAQPLPTGGSGAGGVADGGTGGGTGGGGGGDVPANPSSGSGLLFATGVSGEDTTFSQNPAALAATWADGEPRSAMFKTIAANMNTVAGAASGADAGAATAAAAADVYAASWNFDFGKSVPLFEEPKPQISGDVIITAICKTTGKNRK